jgi:two-component system response regulator AtoC
VRELDNVVQRALILCRDKVLQTRHLPADLLAPAQEREDGAEPVTAAQRPDPPITEAESLDIAQATTALEDRMIAEALRRSGDNKRRAAALLGISERTLWYKLGRAKP